MPFKYFFFLKSLIIAISLYLIEDRLFERYIETHRILIFFISTLYIVSFFGATDLMIGYNHYYMDVNFQFFPVSIILFLLVSLRLIGKWQAAKYWSTLGFMGRRFYFYKEIFRNSTYMFIFLFIFFVVDYYIFSQNYLVELLGLYDEFFKEDKNLIDLKLIWFFIIGPMCFLDMYFVEKWKTRRLNLLFFIISILIVILPFTLIYWHILSLTINVSLILQNLVIFRIIAGWYILGFYTKFIYNFFSKNNNNIKTFIKNFSIIKNNIFFLYKILIYLSIIYFIITTAYYNSKFLEYYNTKLIITISNNNIFLELFYIGFCLFLAIMLLLHIYRTKTIFSNKIFTLNNKVLTLYSIINKSSSNIIKKNTNMSTVNNENFLNSLIIFYMYILFFTSTSLLAYCFFSFYGLFFYGSFFH